MNLLCPNCGKMLTVPEQYAGQMMKCPLCSGTFTVPALPGGGLELPAQPPAQPPAAAAGPPFDPYQLRPEAPPEPAFQTQPAAEPAFSTAPAPPEPAFQTSAPAPSPALPPPSTTAVTTGPGPLRGPDAAGQVPGLGYRGGFSLQISDKVLGWMVPACLVLIFILQFFPWVGLYPGGVPGWTQGAWGAAFGSESGQDLDMKNLWRSSKETPRKGKAEKEDAPSEVRPSISPLLILYLLPLFLITLLLSIAVAALPFLNVPLPPQVQQFLPWRWAALAGLNAVLLLFLILQMVLGFGLENSFKEWVDNQPEIKKEPTDNKEKKHIEVARGSALGMLHRTIYLRLALLLQIVATISAALVFWIEKRGPNAPLPAIDVKW
jgi:hypothetical protein